ncbi:hypothetical protein [Klebsiella variicola]|uniref:hypothetical protein n=1 Tax=Klebsiella variicola TaxID=244366 RepID=UPI0015D4AB67|nr:hypothetical protein [Klebsiella variicola]HCB0985700.1 hypothetical protein [Klebsiella variicola subsp. variicola]HDS5939291.1 hypothetical protein [Klebsiella variicola]HDS5946767.1 hypothetical protein [Klebsiella variicola]HDT2758159.1 hypothetical protein [Klebsiella variicola]
MEGTAIISRVAPAPFFHGVMGKVAISKKKDHGLLGGIQRVDGFVTSVSQHAYKLFTTGLTNPSSSACVGLSMLVYT